MSFDFTKFASMDTKEVGDAFNAAPQEVIADIAKEIVQEENQGAELSAPDVDFNVDEVAEEVEKVGAMTPDDIKKQAEFLKQQKQKSEEKETKTKTESKKTTKDKADKPKKEEKKEEEKKEETVYSRPRRVIAYGEDVYVEDRPDASLDDIRHVLVTRYGYSEFKDKNRCQMKFDAKTGEVYPEIIFNKKG